MSKRVAVVFLSDVAQVAQAGEQKHVAGGFWRNYLKPRGLAVLPEDKRAKELVKRKEQEAAKPVVEEAETKPLPTPKVQRSVRKKEKRAKEVKKSAKLRAKVKEA